MAYLLTHFSPPGTETQHHATLAALLGFSDNDTGCVDRITPNGFRQTRFGGKT
jgi:hypothetical protein